MNVEYVMVITLAVLTVLAHLMEVPGIVIVDVYRRATLVMTVMTVLAYQMVITWKMNVIHVIVTALMIVYRIVLVIGVELP